MKKFFNFTISIFLISVFFVSCYGSWNPFYEGNNVDYRTGAMLNLTDSTNTEFAASGVSGLSGKYNVLILTDTHFGYKNKEAPLPQLFAWLDSVKDTPAAPAFAICLGDAVDTGAQAEYTEYITFCNKLISDYGIKIVFNTAGNHDIYQSHWENWQANCYPHTSFYKFETAGFSWYSLDTASGTVSRQQYDIFKSAIEKDSKPKVVYSHYPLSEYNLAFGYGETTERNLLIDDFLKNNVKAYFGGHNHYSDYDFNGFNDYCCPSFRFNEKWTVIQIDEAAGTAIATFIK